MPAAIETAAPTVETPATIEAAAPTVGMPAAIETAAPTVGMPAAIENAAPTVGMPAAIEAAAPTVGMPAAIEAAAPTVGMPTAIEAAAPTVGMPAVESLKAEQEKLLTSSGQVPAPKSKARKAYDALQAQINGMVATETEAPAVQQVRKLDVAGKDEVTLALDQALNSKQKTAEFREKYPEFVPTPMVTNIKRLLTIQNDPKTNPKDRERAKDALEENFTQKEIDAATRYKEADNRYSVQALNSAVPTTKKFTETVASGQTRKALQTLFTDKDTHPLAKLVAERMLKADTLPKVKVVPANSLGVNPKDPESYRAGVYDTVSDSILLDERAVNGPNLVHEVMHGFLHRKIVEYTHNGRLDAQVKRIDDLYQTLKNNNPELSKEYGMTDLSEFTSEAMSNPEFQDLLKVIPYKKSNFFREFAKSVLKFFGINDTTPKWNALAEAMIATEAAMQTGRALQEVRTGTAGPKAPSNVTPSAVAATNAADIIGETVRPSSLDSIRKFFETKGNPSYLFDKLTSIDKKLTDGYLGRLFDALGNINPKELLAQALDAVRVTERAFVEGFLELTPDGMFTAAKGKLANGEEASLKRIIEIINNSAKQSGLDVKEVRRIFSSLIVGHREFNLDAHNKATGSSVPLRIKNDVERNELEKEFQASPDAKKILEIMDAMRFNRIDMAVYAGRISQETADFWKNTPGYVPYQDIDNLNEQIATIKNGSSKGLSGVSKYKSLVGPDTNPQVGDVVESFMDLMSRMTIDAIKVNAVGKASESMRLLGHAKRISPAGALSREEQTHVVDTYINGVRARYYYKDPLDAAGFAGLPSEVSSVTTFMQEAARMLRAGVTLMPQFAATQVLNDTFRAYALSDVSNPAALIPRILLNFPGAAYREYTGKKSDMDTRMENLGVMASFDVSAQGTLRNIMLEVGAEKRSLREKILHAAESISKGSDMAVRQAIFAQSMKETNDNEALSISRAREIINFSRRGNSKIIDGLVRTVPFTNAYIRGMDKLIGAARGTSGAYNMTQAEAKAMFRNRMLTLGAIGFTYALMMADDDEYQALDENIRDTHFVIPGTNAGIPLPRDLAFIFKAIPERVVNYIHKYGTDEEQSGIRVLGGLMKQGGGIIMAPNMTPSLLLPFLETITNHSFFLNRALESPSQQSREVFTAYGRGTSELSKSISEGLHGAVEISPVKLDNLFRGLLGTSATLLMAMGDAILAPDKTATPLHKSVIAQLSGAGAILIDPVGRKQSNDLYDLHDKLKKINNTYENLLGRDPAKAAKFGAEHVREYEMYPYVKDLIEYQQQLDKEVQAADSYKSMTPDDRQKLISSIIKRKNDAAKGVDAIRTYIEQQK
jgi:hypothetical protein